MTLMFTNRVRRLVRLDPETLRFSGLRVTHSASDCALCEDAPCGECQEGCPPSKGLLVSQIFVDPSHASWLSLVPQL